MRTTGTTDLRAFVAIAEQSSFSKAAEQIGLSPSSLSQIIRALEERLGVRLIDRGSRRFSLTEERELLFECGMGIIAEIDEVAAEVSAKVCTPKGRLRVSARSGIGRRRIAPLVSEFTELDPSSSRQGPIRGNGCLPRS